MEPMQSGFTVQSSIQSLLPGVLSWIQQELKSRDSVTIRFIVTIPPNRQYSSYVTAPRKELKDSLREFYPDSEINVRARPQIDLFGFLTQIAFEVSVRRSGTSRVGKKQVRMDADGHIIIKPGISMLSELRAVIVRLLPKIRADLETKSEVSFTVNVKVPFGSNLATLETLQTNLIAQLARYFPDYDISFTSRTEVMQGASIEVRFTVKLRRNCCLGNEMLPINRRVINLKPGSTIEQELAKYLTTVLSQLETSLARGKPASFIVNIQTFGYLAREGREDLRSQIMSVVSKYFRNARIEIALDGIGGLLGWIICKVDIYPKEASPYYAINLDGAGVDLTMALDDLFMRILPPSWKKLKKPFSFNILLISTRIVNQQFVDQTVKKITDIIQFRFPKSNVKIDTKIENNDWNGRVYIIFEVFLQPGENKGNNDVRKTPDSKKMIIDLSQPIDSLKNQIQVWIQGLISGSKDDLKDGLSLGFQFEVKPSLKNTKKSDLKMVSSFILLIVTAAFPNLRVDMKEIDEQDDEGFIEEAEIKVTIHPEARADYQESIAFPDKFIIDSYTPGTPIDSLLVGVIPKIFEMIEKFGKKYATYTIQFLIKSPDGIPQKYMRDITTRIIGYLSKYLPEYGIDFFSDGITDRGIIEESILSVVLIPGKFPVGEGIRGVTPPFTFQRVFPGNISQLLPKINEWLQTEMENIFEKLTKSSVTLELRVNATNKTNVEFDTMKLDEIKELIIDLFRHCNIGFGITTMKDKKGFIKQITISVTIEPASSNPDIMKQPSRRIPPRTENKNTPPPYTPTIPPQTEDINIPPPYKHTVQSRIDDKNTPPPDTYTIPPRIEDTNTPPCPTTVLPIIEDENTPPPCPYTKPPKIEDKDIPPPCSNTIPPRIEDENIPLPCPNTVPSTIEDQMTTPSYLSAVPPGIESPLANKIPTISLTFDSPVDIEAQVRQSLSNLSVEIWNILETGFSYDLQYSMKFPQGTDLVRIEDIVGRIKHVFEQEYPNDNVNVTIGDMQRNGNSISTAVVLVVIEALKQPMIIMDKSPKNNTEAIKIDLSNPLPPIDALLQSLLLNIIGVVQKYLNLKDEIIVNLNIIPPARSGTSFLYRITDFLVPLITASFSKTETKWDIDTTTDLNGFLVDVNLKITFQPSKKLLQTGSNDCLECMNIDISEAGSGLDQKLDKILPTIYARILTILEKGKKQILNFKFVPPPKSSAAYFKEASNSLSMILQNYFPYNPIEMEIKEDQTDEGYLENVKLMVTIHPDKNPLPPSNIKIPIDISHGGSANVNVKNALKAHMSQIQALQDQNSAVVIGFQIYPPLGAKGDYLDMLMSEIIDSTKDLFSGKSIDTNIKAAKNSKQEYVRIEGAVTLS